MPDHQQLPEPGSVAGRDPLLDRLYAVHRPWLLGYVTRLAAGDRGRAEDIVQETMLRAWRHGDRLRTDDENALRSWLARVAHNLAIDRYRSRQSRGADTDLDGAPVLAVPDRTDAVLDKVVVARALAELSTEHRDIPVQVYFRGRTAAEAAAALGIPVGTAKSRVYYAVKSLRLVLREQQALAGEEGG
jgi:RNA polymerase sigma-70 factor, ECF subfamily